MKFAKVLEEKLVQEEIPEEWVEAAIQYKALKKCINKVVEELRQFGLERSTLKLLIDEPDTSQVIEVANDECQPSNPIIAKYTLTKATVGEHERIVPILKLSLDHGRGDSEEQMSQVAAELKARIDNLISEDSVIEKVIEKRVASPTEEKAVLLAPKEGSPIPEDNIDEIVGGRPTEVAKVKSTEFYIILKSDTKFFLMLDEELENLDYLRNKEEQKLIGEVSTITDVVQSVSNPTKVSKRKSDLYKWRELFKMYLESEVYFRYNETSSTVFERNAEQVKQKLAIFLDRVEKTNLVSSFKSKRSVVAFHQFTAMNYHLLKVLQFQSINSTAFTKILKKFDKQTSLGIKYRFPKLVSNDHIFITGSSIAKSICYIVQTSLISVAPQLDDYTCPICASIAFKPIKLVCGHIFCVRCLVKLKQQAKHDCPFCRRENAVAQADSLNLDMDSLALMQSYFPKEIKDKLKERDKERYDEMVGNQKCVIA